MKEIRVDIRNKIATYNTRDGAIVCENNNYRIRFTFDEEWNQHPVKQARFIWNDKYLDVVFTGDTVPVPIISQATTLTVGVYAGEKLRTTTPAQIPCLRSIICESGRAKEADYYEEDGTLQHRLPAIRPEDNNKLLQAVDGKYELREAPDLTMNEEMVGIALETKVKPVQDSVNKAHTDINALGNRVTNNETNIRKLNKLPAIIFEDEEEIISLANKLGVDNKTIMGIVKQLADDVDALNKFQEEHEEEEGAICIPFKIKKWGIEVDVGGLYIVLGETLAKSKIFVKIADYKWVITDWEEVQQVLEWIETFGTYAVAWIADNGEIIYKWFVDTGEDAVKWVTETGEEIEEWYNGIVDGAGDLLEDVGEGAEGVGNAIGGFLSDAYNWVTGTGEEIKEKTDELYNQVNATQNNIKGATWILGDTIAEEFSHDFTFVSNGELYTKMDCVKRINQAGNEYYVLHYFDSNGKSETIYNTQDGWIDEANKIIIAQNTNAYVTATLQKIDAGVTWVLNDTFDTNNLGSYRIVCDFVSNNENFKALGFGIGYDGIHLIIKYFTSANIYEHSEIIVYDASQGGWLDEAYRTIVVFKPTERTTKILRKIGSDATEQLTTYAQTVVGAVNALNQGVGDMSKLEVEETTGYSMRSRMSAQRTLVGAVNEVYRRTIAVEEASQPSTDENLKTTNKTIVGAINEVNKHIADVNVAVQSITEGYTKVGSAETADKLVGEANLNTTDKTVIGAINELNSKKNDKIDIISVTGNPMDIAVKNDGILWENFFSMNDGAYTGDFYHRVPIVAGDNVTFEVEGSVVKINAQGGSSSKAIIDVIELPTENINEEAFYRVLSAKWVVNGEAYNSFICYCVDTLPDTAIPATTDMVNITAYYNASDGGVYGYVDGMLAGYFGIPSGWYPAEMLFQTVGWNYGGVITDIKDSENDFDFKVLLSYILYTYKDGKWETVKGVGSAGTGINAEVFNGDNNQATGDYSHAEGDFTHAKGRNSHTEGECTVASARNQHTQGRYNIEDTEERYAHIVGNGEDGNRSNAHTLDWQGNAWYQGKIYTGGTGQDDAKELATVDYVDTKIAESGGSSGGGSNVVSKYTIETSPSTTVIDMINAIQNEGGNIGAWNVIVLTGYISDTFGLQMAHYGGSVYNINGVNLNSMTTVSNVNAWDGVSLGAFQVMFRPPLPYYDESNEGQVLKVVNGVPTWVTP